MRRNPALPVAVLAPLLLIAACGGTDDAGDGTADGTAGAAQADGEPIRVGLVTSTSGPLSTYGAQYVAGFEAGLEYATDGTGAVGGRPIEVEVVDDAGDPEQAVSAAVDLVGQGVTILAGTASSGIAVQLAPFAEENDVLYISGPAATDAITGANDNTFRSGRQTYQDVATAASLVDDVEGSDVLVLAQDSEFGAGNVAAVEAVLGGAGATVDSLLVPAATNEFTPFAAQVLEAAPDLLFVAWAGDTSAAMWQSLQQQGVFDATTVATGLGDRATYPAYGTSPEGIDFLAHYVPGAAGTEVEQAMIEAVGEDGVDLFTPDGFVAAQMVVQAVSEGQPDDVGSMISALEGWTFDAPKGTTTIRAGDHAMLQPMFTARLTAGGTEPAAEVVDTLAPEDTAPPEGAGE
jgi:branched-chain amino acid transport system substrate-binding protein